MVSHHFNLERETKGNTHKHNLIGKTTPDFISYNTRIKEKGIKLSLCLGRHTTSLVETKWQNGPKAARLGFVMGRGRLVSVGAPFLD